MKNATPLRSSASTAGGFLLAGGRERRGAAFLAACDSMGPRLGQAAARIRDEKERGARGAVSSVILRLTFRAPAPRVAGDAFSILFHLAPRFRVWDESAAPRRVAARGGRGW